MKIMLDGGAYMPERAHKDDAGLDLRSPIEIYIRAGDYAIIDTGVHVDIPKGCVGMLKSKSGLNVKHGLIGEGVIDAGYTGSIVCKLYNIGGSDYRVKRGDKIIQLVVLPIVTPEPVLVDSFDKTDRGNNGFGSTGR